MPVIPLSLYVHFPWCVKKCPYCDFNSHSLRNELPEEAYVDALIRDLRQQLVSVPDRPIATVFMGGGTPSLISAGQIRRLMDALKESGRIQNDAEVTLEANPGTLDEARFEDFLYAGVNRLSIGVQSFDDLLLQKIGRIHTAAQAERAVARAERAGFQRINLDLMYGLPGQLVEVACNDLEQALQMGVEHLSLYQLTIEPNTEFAHRPPAIPDPDQCGSMQDALQRRLKGAAYQQYEVSAYTRNQPCQHNLNYWLYGDYLAIGAGAHGKLSHIDPQGVIHISRYWNHRHPDAYLRASTSGEFCARTNIVEAKERDIEFLMNALRLKQGFAISDYERRTGGVRAELLEKLAPIIAKGWLEHSAETIRASTRGYRFLDSVLLECF